MPVQDQIRERIRFLLNDISQSDIARKTNTSPANVHRYLANTRIPVDFCCDLVKAFDLNPAWLFMGEGVPFLTDISAQTGGLASDMLELVSAMNSISDMKLGSLLGKQHAGNVLEFNNALKVHEEARLEITEKVRPTFRQLADDMRQAVSNREYDRAVFLKSALEQVSRLCSDDQAEMVMLRSFVLFEYFFTKDFDKALALQRNVFHRSLRNCTELVERNFYDTHTFVMTLAQNGFLREGRSICAALIALADKEKWRWPTSTQLVFTHGWLDIELGKLKRGHKRLRTAYLKMPEGLQQLLVGHFLYSQLLSGEISLASALKLEHRGGSIHSAYLRFACWLEDQKLLEGVLDLYNRAPQQSDARPLLALRAEFILMALRATQRQKPQHLIRKFQERLEKERRDKGAPLLRAFFERVTTTQLARIMGNKRKAREEFEKAESVRLKVPSEQTPMLLIRAMHDRNGIALLSGSQHATKKRRLYRKSLSNLKRLGRECPIVRDIPELSVS